jgi:hypothetical protein
MKTLYAAVLALCILVGCAVSLGYDFKEPVGQSWTLHDSIVARGHGVYIHQIVQACNTPHSRGTQWHYEGDAAWPEELYYWTTDTITRYEAHFAEQDTNRDGWTFAPSLTRHYKVGRWYLTETAKWAITRCDTVKEEPAHAGILFADSLFILSLDTLYGNGKR